VGRDAVHGAAVFGAVKEKEKGTRKKEEGRKKKEEATQGKVEAR
jgi:hypothetical protein